MEEVVSRGEKRPLATRSLALVLVIVALGALALAWRYTPLRDFVNAAARVMELGITWKGSGVDEKGYDERGSCIVAVDPRYFRPTEVESLLGDASKARRILGWAPKVTFQDLVSEMVYEDLQAAGRDELVRRHGYKAMEHHE